MKKDKIIIKAEVNASLEKVWNYWVNPEHITNWNFASDDWHCPSATNDLKIGGQCKTRMEAKDGSFGFDLSYKYDDIQDQEQLIYTLDDGRNVITSFNFNNSKTSVETQFEPESENSIEMQKNGWQAILNNFKKYTENN